MYKFFKRNKYICFSGLVLSYKLLYVTQQLKETRSLVGVLAVHVADYLGPGPVYTSCTFDHSLKFSKTVATSRDC